MQPLHTALAVSNHGYISASACGDPISRPSLTSVTLPCELQVVLKMGQIVVEDVNIKVGLDYPRHISLPLTMPWAGLIPGGYDLDFFIPPAHTANQIAQSVLCRMAASSLQCAIDVGWS